MKKNQLLQVMLLFMLISISLAKAGNINTNLKVLRICTFHNGSSGDTLCGIVNSLGEIPLCIKWNRESVKNKNPITYFVYPDGIRNVSYSIMKMNKDTLDDIVINIDYMSSDSNIRIPQNKNIVILGQDRMRKTSEIDLESFIIANDSSNALRSSKTKAFLNDKVTCSLGQLSCYPIKQLDINVDEPIVDDTASTIADVRASDECTIFKIYPNPACDKAILSVIDLPIADYTISISTLNGRIIYEENLQKAGGTFNKSIGLDAFADGVYYLLVKNSKQEIVFISNFTILK